MMLCRKVLFFGFLLSISRAQQYDDYPEYQDYADNYDAPDNLYEGYAERQQQKAVG